MKTKKKDGYILLMVLVISTALFSRLFFSFWQENQRIAKTEYQNYVDNYIYQLNSMMETAIEPSKYIVYLLQKNQGEIDDFEGLCEATMEGDVTQAIQLLPEGVITQSYPMVGNEKAIGIDCFNDLKRAKYAYEALEGKQPVITPVTRLKQGNSGIVCYYPVFYNNDAGEECFYGFVATVINTQRLYEIMNLEYLKKSDIGYGIYCLNKEKNKKVPVWENNADVMALPVYGSFKILDQEWSMVMDAEKGMTSQGYTIKTIVCVITCFVVAKLLLMLQHQKDALDVLANTDGLTGLTNRRCFETRVMETKCKENKPFGFFYMDLDRFKEINDTYGHDAGDFVLKTIADRIQKILGEDSIVARIGGDEFVAAVTTDETEAIEQEFYEKANEIRTTIREEFVYQGKSLSCGVSVGVSVFPKDGLTLEELQKKADDYMYKDKRKRE